MELEKKLAEERTGRLDELFNDFGEDSYESVLREEFETMRLQYEGRLKSLQATLSSERSCINKLKDELSTENEKLKLQV